MKRKCTECKKKFVSSKSDLKQIKLESLRIGIPEIICQKCLSGNFSISMSQSYFENVPSPYQGIVETEFSI